MKTHILQAKELPIYERAIAYYPHLASIKFARAFCFNLGNLAVCCESP